MYGEYGFRHVAGERWDEHNLVLPSPTGTPLEHSKLRRRVRRLCQRADLSGDRFQDLRYTVASRMATSNMPPCVVMELLGHPQISTTMEIYLHVSTEEMSRAVNGHETAEPSSIRTVEGL